MIVPPSTARLSNGRNAIFVERISAKI